jgi:hypothetical protein
MQLKLPSLKKEGHLISANFVRLLLILTGNGTDL